MQFFLSTEYQPTCTRLFEDYKNKIEQLIPFAVIEHIGSSAIPHAISKGDLDIYMKYQQKIFCRPLNKLNILILRKNWILYAHMSCVCLSPRNMMSHCKSL
jgi:GrpB-like predicted nucleotidyltransferase (UPF0157 family)